MKPLIDANEVTLSPPPTQRRRLCSARIKPSRFAGSVAVMALLNMASPTTEFVGSIPPAALMWPVETKRGPRMAFRRVLQNSAPFANRRERRSKAALVIALDQARPRRRGPPPISSPSLARRMSDDGVRSGVSACVTLTVPWIDAINPEIAAALQDKKCCDQVRGPGPTPKAPSALRAWPTWYGIHSA